MSQDDEFVTAVLDKVFDGPLPPTAVNAERLLRRGRHLLHRRRTTRSLSAAAAVAVAALLVTTLPGARQAQPGTTGGASLLAPGRFGWLPEPPKAYTYLANTDSSEISAVWGNMTIGAGPQLTLLPADGDQVLPNTAPVAGVPADEKPTRVGTVDGNPVWYYSYTAGLQTVVLQGSIVWRTASGYWAVLYDPQADGATLLHIAATADTTPTPFKVPLVPSGAPARLSNESVMLTQPVDDSGLEFSISGYLGPGPGAEQLIITGFAGDTGLTRQNGTKCDYPTISWLGSYQSGCLIPNGVPERDPFGSSAAAPGSTTPATRPTTPPARTTTSPPTTSSSQPTSPSSSTPSEPAGSSTAPTVQDTVIPPSQGTPSLKLAFSVLNGIDVYVGVFVHSQYSQSLANTAITQLTSFGTNPADWQQP
jgi:hypothetical protein